MHGVAKPMQKTTTWAKQSENNIELANSGSVQNDICFRLKNLHVNPFVWGQIISRVERHSTDTATQTHTHTHNYEKMSVE